MEEKEILTDEEIKESIDKLSELFDNNPPKDNLPPLSELNLFETNEEIIKPTPYTTELIENIQKIEPSLTVSQITDLLNYIKGSSRPEFMDSMLTQTNEKLVESLKLMSILQLTRLPALFDYLNALQKNMLNPEAIKDLTFEDISKVSVNVQKEISEILSLAIQIATKLPAINTMPTKVEKLANALMGVSESTRQRIEEILEMEQ